MKMRVKHWFVVICLSVFSQLAFGNIYMGTDSDVPSNVQARPGGLAVPFADKTQDMPAACQPYSGKGPMPANPCMGKLVAVQANKPMVVSVRTGSLKDNVEKITRQGGWHNLVWRPNYDFKWLGNVTITGRNIQDVLAKLLEPYPLQAVFYESNHVVAIVPRRST